MTYRTYLLISLMEEAAELQKACAKALKFGLDSKHPDHPNGSTNREDISREFDCLVGTHRILRIQGTLRSVSRSGSIHKGRQLLEWYGQLQESEGNRQAIDDARTEVNREPEWRKRLNVMSFVEVDQLWKLHSNRPVEGGCTEELLHNMRTQLVDLIECGAIDPSDLKDK